MPRNAPATVRLRPFAAFSLGLTALLFSAIPAAHAELPKEATNNSESIQLSCVRENTGTAGTLTFRAGTNLPHTVLVGQPANLSLLAMDISNLPSAFIAEPPAGAATMDAHVTLPSAVTINGVPTDSDPYYPTASATGIKTGETSFTATSEVAPGFEFVPEKKQIYVISGPVSYGSEGFAITLTYKNSKGDNVEPSRTITCNHPPAPGFSGKTGSGAGLTASAPLAAGAGPVRYSMVEAVDPEPPVPPSATPQAQDRSPQSEPQHVIPMLVQTDMPPTQQTIPIQISRRGRLWLLLGSLAALFGFARLLRRIQE